MISGVLLTGPVGVGKTAVSVEVAEMVDDVAVLDLDWLGWFRPPGPLSPDDLITRNLALVWPTFREAGARRLVLGRALIGPDRLDALRRSVPDVELAVVRLTAPGEVLERRLRGRDAGATLAGHLAEREAWREDGLDVPSVPTQGRSVREVAEAVLAEVGWLG